MRGSFDQRPWNVLLLRNVWKDAMVRGINANNVSLGNVTQPNRMIILYFTHVLITAVRAKRAQVAAGSYVSGAGGKHIVSSCVVYDARESLPISKPFSAMNTRGTLMMQ